MLEGYKFKRNDRPVFGAKDAFYKEEEVPRFSGIDEIIKATREQRFSTPYIQEPEKRQIEGTKFIEDAPRSRKPDDITSGVLKGLSQPILGAYQELSQSGDEFKQGNIGGGIADLLKGTLHTAMTPITMPFGAGIEGIKATGEVGGEVAQGLEQVMNLPFDAIKQGSEIVKQVVESTGLDISDSETSKKFNDLAIEVGGLLLMGKGIREAKKYVEAKVPEIKTLPKDPELVIRSQETKPVEGLTQEKLPIDISKETLKVNPEQVNPQTGFTNFDFKETPKVDFNTRFYNANKIAVENILGQEGLLTPKQVSRRLTSLVEQGKLSKRVSLETVKQIVNDWNASRPKRQVQEIKGTENELGISLPKELNTTRAVSFDRNSGLSIKSVLEESPEFRPYIKDLTDVNEVTAKLNELYWKKRENQPLPELEKTPETSFNFGENVTSKDLSVKQIMDNPAQEYPTPTAMKEAQRILGDKFNAEFEKFSKEIEGTNVAPTGNKMEMFARRVVAADKLGVNEILGDKFYEAYKKATEDAGFIETTSIKNEMMNKEREFRGLEPLETKEVRKQEPLIEDAQRKIESGEIDPNKLAKEIVDNPRILSDSDVAVLQVNARRLKNETTKLVEEISKETDPIKTQELRQKALELEEQYNLNDIASKQTGTDTARALAIRRLELKDDYSIAPLIQRAKIANKGEVVPEEIRFKLETYSKQITEAEAKVNEYQQKLALAEADRVLREATAFEQRTQRRTSIKQDLDLEYQNLLKEFASTQQLNALVDPKQIQIMVKAAKNRLKKGVTNIEQVVDQLYQDMKPYMAELTKQDIIEAIGGLGRFKKMTEGDIKSELRGIKKQVTDETLQKSYKTRLENRKAELEKMLETGNFEKTPRRKTPMNPELSKLKDEVDLLKLKADREIRELELKNRTTEEKVKDTVVDIANIPRTMMSSIDLSAPLRQGVIQSFAHPKIVFGKDGAFREMFKYFKDEKSLRELQRNIEESPNAVLYNKSGLYLANEKTNIGKMSGREEAFLSNLPQRIPILGRGIRGSERAYTGFLDKLRMDMFDFHVDNFQKSGISFESNPKAFKDLAKMINSSTGRGTLGGFERSATALSTLLFSPRLIASRLQMMNPRWYFGKKLDPAVRKILWKDMSRFVGVGTSIMALSKLAGVDIETDPRSTDFAKIKLGNTRLDIWGGFQQYGVFFARELFNSTKQLDGKVKSLSGEQFPFRNRWDLAVRFGEQKMSPMAGFIKDYIKGENFEGEDFKLTNQALNIMIPLYLQDMYEAMQEDGIEGAFKTVPAVFGVGTQTYKPKQPTLKF